MKAERIDIAGIPAILYGEPSDRSYLFLHGKCGHKEEAEEFATLACAAGNQVLSIDLPEHGERIGMRNAFNPWTVVPELQKVMGYVRTRWNEISIRANSIGAYFSMLAFGGAGIRKALLVSPIVDMEQLIADMMTWADVKEEVLREKGELSTGFGETLSWQYLCWVREHPIEDWSCPTAILYAGRDNLTARSTVEMFTVRHHAALTVIEDGEHWFHTAEQIKALRAWERDNIG